MAKNWINIELQKPAIGQIIDYEGNICGIKARYVGSNEAINEFGELDLFDQWMPTEVESISEHDCDCGKSKYPCYECGRGCDSYIQKNKATSIEFPYTIKDLRSMLEDVITVLDPSEEMIAKHGELGTAPAELVRLVLEQKDREIQMLKNGFKQINP